MRTKKPSDDEGLKLARLVWTATRDAERMSADGPRSSPGGRVLTELSATMALAMQRDNGSLPGWLTGPCRCIWDMPVFNETTKTRLSHRLNLSSVRQQFPLLVQRRASPRVSAKFCRHGHPTRSARLGDSSERGRMPWTRDKRQVIVCLIAVIAPITLPQFAMKMDPAPSPSPPKVGRCMVWRGKSGVARQKAPVKSGFVEPFVYPEGLTWL